MSARNGNFLRFDNAREFPAPSFVPFMSLQQTEAINYVLKAEAVNEVVFLLYYVGSGQCEI